MTESAFRIAAAAGGAGRGLFSNRALEAGDVIFELERPLIAVVDTSALEYTCEWCFDGVGEAALGQPLDPDEATRLFRCTGCKLVKYCSKTCQSSAWKHHHRFECKLFASFMPHVLPNASRMLVQMLLRRKKGAISESQWKEFLALQHHADDFRRGPPGKGQLKNLQITAVAGKSYGGASESLEQCEELAGRIFINTQTLVNPIYHPLGQCLDPLPASINHACMPNAVVVFSGSVMTLRATSAIPKGKEITISYIDSTFNAGARRSELGDRYFFECKCEDCVNDLCFGLPAIPSEWFEARPPPSGQGQGSPLKSLLELDKLGLRHQQEAEVILLRSRREASSDPGNIPDEYYHELCKGLSVYLQQDGFSCYPPGRQPLAKLRFDVVVELLARSLFIPAFILSLQNYYDVDPVHYPFVCHPVHVVHVYTISRLANHVHYLDLAGDDEVRALGSKFGMLGQWASVSQALFGQVMRCAPQSHGENSRLTKQVNMEYQAAAAAALGGNEHAKLLLDQQIGPNMGIRDDQVWKGPTMVAREGWAWYRQLVEKKQDIDAGVKILTRPRSTSTPQLLRPSET